MELTLLNYWGEKHTIEIPDNVMSVVVRVYSELGLSNIVHESIAYKMINGETVEKDPFVYSQRIFKGCYFIYIKGLRNDIPSWNKRDGIMSYLESELEWS